MLSLNPPLPLPALPTITTRVATMADLPFIDGLQKKHSKQLGFFPRAQIEGYLRNGWMRIAEESGQWAVGSGQSETEDKAFSSSSLPTAHCPPPTRVGYVAFRDRYQKRDELGAVFQLCVDPTRQRGLIGATLLKSAFDNAAYGCRLFCCWCAQDLAANKFWESMGFVPLAFRGGSTKKSRVHLFWQRRIRADDHATPYWFPAKTEGGALREDRLVLPIPPGVRWDEAMPVVVGSGQGAVGSEEKKARSRSKKSSLPTAHCPPPTPRRMKARFGPPGAVFATTPTAVPAIVETLPAIIVKAKRPAIDPRMVSAARELRDRWLEQVNATATTGSAGRYEVGRAIESTPSRPMLAA